MMFFINDQCIFTIVLQPSMIKVDHSSQTLSTIELLPMEMRLQIMMALPDVWTLRQLVESSDVLRTAFETYRFQIVNTICRTTFHPSLLLEMQASYNATNLPRLTHKGYQKGVENFYSLYKRKSGVFQVEALDNEDAGKTFEKLLFLGEKGEELVRLQVSIDHFIDGCV